MLRRWNRSSRNIRSITICSRRRRWHVDLQLQAAAGATETTVAQQAQQLGPEIGQHLADAFRRRSAITARTSWAMPAQSAKMMSTHMACLSGSAVYTDAYGVAIHLQR